MIVKEHYDVIVVGTDLAPLLCAALLCKRGFRVLVVGDGSPEPEPLTGVICEIDSPVARRVLAELGIQQVVRRMEQALDPRFQMVTPGVRLDVHADHERLMASVAREIPAEAAAAKAFYEAVYAGLESVDRVLAREVAIPPRGFIEKQRLRRLLSSTPFGQDGLGGRLLDALASAPGLRTCLLAHIVPRSRLERGQIVPVHAALLHGRAVRSQVLLRDGLAGLKDLLRKRVSNTRGEARTEERIEEIEIDGGRVVHVRLAGHESATGCDTLVSGVRLGWLAGLVRQDGSRIDGRALGMHGLEMVAHRATIGFVLRDEAFPEPMARLVHVIFDENEPPFEANLAVLERLSGSDEGTSGLGVSFLVGHARLLEDPSCLRAVAAEVKRRLRRVVPFLEGFVIDERPVPDLGPPSGSDEDPSEAIARVLPALYRTSSPGPWGACGVGFTTRIPNVVVCSAEVLPGFGDEGQWIAAWGAAGLVASRDRSRTRWKSRL